MERNYVLPPQFIKFGDEIINGRRLHSFQSALAHVMEQKEDCLIINAPTGAGKTFAFGLATGCSSDNPFGGKVVKTLILSPTNALISQTFKDLSEEWESQLLVGSFSSRDLRSAGSKRGLEIMERIRNNDITVTNPDIISLLIAGQYHWASRDSRKERQWSDVFKNISVMISTSTMCTMRKRSLRSLHSWHSQERLVMTISNSFSLQPRPIEKSWIY